MSTPSDRAHEGDNLHRGEAARPEPTAGQSLDTPSTPSPGRPTEALAATLPGPPIGTAATLPIDAYAATLGSPAAAAPRDPAAAATAVDQLGKTFAAGPTGPAAEDRFPVLSWDRYEFIGLLGQGGMGAVYKARDRRLQRLVALKFIRGEDQRLIQRFQKEARAQSRIENPGICKVYDVGEVNGKHYISMQYIDGLSLRELSPSLSILQKAIIIQTAAASLHAAHQLGIVHRDIKPSNIMIENGENGQHNPIIMDFGLASDTADDQSLTESGLVMGTAGFMSPEQASGNTKFLDRRSDIYSLGATLFDLLCGRPPFLAESIADTLLQVTTKDAPSVRSIVPDIPVALDIIVAKCLNKEPQQRYQSAQELSDDISRFINNRKIVAKRLGLYHLFRLRARRNKPAAAGFVALVACLFILMIFGIRSRWKTIQQQRQFQLQTEQAERRAKQQAELAERLGQEIKEMEWMLRSSRQLPIHNLDREKKIMIARMNRLHAELSGYGELTRGLGHYALGRGYMALQKYPEALEQLQLAVAAGNARADLQYALGIVLGKHFEQAMVDVRMAGGGRWAKQQQALLESKFLRPAIRALQASRASDTSEQPFLDGLIAHYKGDYSRAIKLAQQALDLAPWLYESQKLIADVHLQIAASLFDKVELTAADNELRQAISILDNAVLIAQSDAEVYIALADAWARRVAISQQARSPIEPAFSRTMEAAEKISLIDPQSGASALKRAYALQWRITAQLPQDDMASLARQCQNYTQQILSQQPDNLLAATILSNCTSFLAHSFYKEGKSGNDLRKLAITILEPVTARYPTYLEGIRSLGFRWQEYALFARNPAADYAALVSFDKAIDALGQALALDPSDASALAGRAETAALALALPMPEGRRTQLLELLEADTRRCHELAGEHYACQTNRMLGYAASAEQRLATDGDTSQYVAAAVSSAQRLLKLESPEKEVERGMAQVYWLLASHKIRQGDSPAEALRLGEQAVARCLKLDHDEPACRATAAKLKWVQATSSHRQPAQAQAALRSALSEAKHATRVPRCGPEEWQVLAETHLRLARLALPVRVKHQHVQDGVAALQRALTLNPQLASGHFSLAQLYLQRAEGEQGAERREAGLQALAACQQAVRHDAGLSRRCAELQPRARQLAGEAPPSSD